jgi:hypothetical protein
MDQDSKSQNTQATQRNRTDHSRRDFVKKAAYVTPLILSFSANPALAQVGSGCPHPGPKGCGGGGQEE